MTLSLLSDRGIDPALRAILLHASNAAKALEIAFFVGGAMARDILLVHVFDQEVRRATRDVDLGIYIADWGQFQQLKTLLCATGKFHCRAGETHRLHFGAPVGIPLDLIPFGPIESPARSIAWPPDHHVVLNVAGFEDAFASAVNVDLGDGLTIKTCSLPSLAVLKLLAWKDRRKITGKDASDFLWIAQRYAEAGNMDRLFEHEPALLVAAKYDPDLAGAMLLGKDAALQSQPGTAVLVQEILASDSLRQELIDQIIRANAATLTKGAEQSYQRLMDAFRAGFISRLLT